jgi:8-amino-7-oxononanoate synthase
MKKERNHLAFLSGIFNSLSIPYEKPANETPVKAVIIRGNTEVKKIALVLQDKGFDVRPVLYPTVPKGKERLRINLHAFNTEEEVRQLGELLAL